MVIRMLKNQSASNDGYCVDRYKKNQILYVPRDITLENAKIFAEEGFAEILKKEDKPQNTKIIVPENTKGDVDIIDIDEPEQIKELTNKPLFTSNNNKNKGKWNNK